MSISINKAITSFREYLLTNKKISESTMDLYLKDINEFTHYLINNKTKLETCSGPVIRTFLSYLASTHQGRSSIYRKISALKMFLHYVSQQYALQDLRKFCTMPCILPVACSEKDLQYIFTKIDYTKLSLNDLKAYLIIELLYITKQKLTEVLTLQYSQISDNTLTLLIKSKSKAYIKLKKNLYNKLQYYKSRTNIKTQYIFSNTTHSLLNNNQYCKEQPLSKSAALSLIKRFLKKHIHKSNQSNTDTLSKEAQNTIDIQLNSNASDTDFYTRYHPRS